MRELAYADATALVERSMAEATRLSLRVSVAVVDDARELVAFGRMDGAIPASIEIAQGKAYTARSLERDTRDVAPETLPGAPLYGLQTIGLRGLITFGGGRVLRRGGRTIGAVAVAGGTPEQAEQILAVVLEGWEAMSEQEVTVAEQGKDRPRPCVVPLAATPVVPPEAWPENVAVANMVTREGCGSDLLLGACWLEPGQVANPWSFEEEDPRIPGVTHWGPVHETYFVLSGRLVLSWDEGELEIGPQDGVYLAPGWRYGLRNVGDERAFLIWSMTPAPV